MPDLTPSGVSLETEAAADRLEAAVNRKRRGGGCGKLLLLTVLVALISVPFILAYYGSQIKRAALEIVKASQEGEEKIVERVIEKEVVQIVPGEPEPPPLPDKFVSYKSVDAAEFYNEILLKTELNAEEGGLASAEREDKEAYTVEFKLNLRVPKPNQTLDDLAGLNPHLPKALPGLKPMMETAKVSNFYHRLYELKVAQVKTNLTRLNRVLSRHNFYDCETILELTHPDSKQPVLLMQGEMDVVSDGSDGDRMAKLDDYITMSDHYQPFSSYGWPKKTDTPNPLLSRFETSLAQAKKDYAAKKSSDLKARVSTLEAQVRDLKARSFLIAEHDPFIVLPLSLHGYASKTKFGAAIGDYAIVIYEDKVYPAIIGDAGPREKMGEASLRIAKEINDKANPYRRPVSDLKVTYLIFPQSADKPFRQPVLADWRERCAEFLNKIGGIGEGYTLHEWADRFHPKPPPEATPAPAPEAPASGATPPAN